MADALKLSLLGVPEARAALNQFSDAIRRKHTRISLNKGLGILKTEAVKRVPTETKLLQKAIGVKAGTTKDGNKVYGLVGPRRGRKRAVSLTAKGKVKFLGKKGMAKVTDAGGTLDFRNPSRYAHLVHGGTKAHAITTKNKGVLASKTAIFGKSVTVKAKAQPFLAQAVSAQGPAATGAIIGKLKEGVAIEAAKALAKSARVKA